MEIIMPAAGLSTRFPNMKPKYTLIDFAGVTMFERSITPYIGKYHITIGLLKENEEKYSILNLIEEKYKDDVSVVLLDQRTTGPADTVYQILKKSNLDTTKEILIKDCDSFFDHEYQSGNYICVSNVKDHEVIRRLGEKSFVVVNNQGIVNNIIEKQVISDKFCVGGYKFESANMFIEAFEQLSSANFQEIFVSHIIETCLNNHHIFKESLVSNYCDVGTVDEWVEYNDKAVMFSDRDIAG
jgi:hypothetical protein